MYGAVVIEEGTLLSFSNGTEYRAGAPVGQMVVAGVELDGAEIRQHHGAVIGIALDHGIGNPTTAIQKAGCRTHHTGKESGDLGYSIQAGRPVIHLIAAAKLQLAVDLIVDVVDGFRTGGMNLCQRFCTVVREYLFDGKGCGSSWAAE